MNPYNSSELNQKPRTQRRRSTRPQSAFVQSSTIPNLIFYNEKRSSFCFQPSMNETEIPETSNIEYPFYSVSNGKPLGYCDQCEAYSNLLKCQTHCDQFLCETCQHDHWQDELKELLEFKSILEMKVDDTKRYLESKRKQCSENLKNSQQIKKFITMTMQQIRRKIELELENKRDELYNTIDTFVENQKKINQSISDEGFTTSSKLFQEIENVVFMTETMNFFKLKNLKELTKLEIQRMEKERGSRVPFYSILFVPDSTVQIQNSFGKIVLKNYDDDDENNLIKNNENFYLKKKPYETESNQPTNSRLRADSLYKWNSTDNLNNRKSSLFQPKSFSAFKSTVYDSLNSLVHEDIPENNEDNLKPKPRNKSVPPQNTMPKLRKPLESGIYNADEANQNAKLSYDESTNGVYEF